MMTQTTPTLRRGTGRHEPAYADDRHDPTVDPRVAATGGRRRLLGDSKANYEWPGMTPWPDWQRTQVHRHTHAYACAKCGATFGSPHAVYTHLAKRHPAKGFGATRANVKPSMAPTNGNVFAEDAAA